MTFMLLWVPKTTMKGHHGAVFSSESLKEETSTSKLTWNVGRSLAVVELKGLWFYGMLVEAIHSFSKLHSALIV